MKWTLLIFSPESLLGQGLTQNKTANMHIHTHTQLIQVGKNAAYSSCNGYDLPLNVIYCLTSLAKFNFSENNW